MESTTRSLNHKKLNTFTYDRRNQLNPLLNIHFNYISANTERRGMLDADTINQYVLRIKGYYVGSAVCHSFQANNFNTSEQMHISHVYHFPLHNRYTDK